MRLIDADKLRSGIEFVINDSKELVTSRVVRNAMLALVDRACTIDAVPGVYCKDCKHYLTEDVECPCNIGLADASPDAQYTWTPEPDWFCADGERKEDDEQQT